MPLSKWKRLDFLAHRWTAIVLGVLVFCWFVSGIALMYYPWPALTESRQLAMLEPLNLRASDSAIGFAPAAAATAEAVGGRLVRRGGRLLYEIWRDDGRGAEPAALVDATRGVIITPISDSIARVIASPFVPGDARARIELLETGDRYMMSAEYRRYFPAWRVRFQDAAATAVYVSRMRAIPFAVVTRLTRMTTWIGVVPHWLYFRWLYVRSGLWTWANLLLPAAAAIIAITGIAFGLAQLLPRHKYRGASYWHHVAGVGFGIFVLTWLVTGVLEMLGGDNAPRAGQAELARGGRAVLWDRVHVNELRAVEAAAQFARNTANDIVAVDLMQLRGRPGYSVHFPRGREVWVDADDGTVRGDMSESEAIATASSVSAGNVTRADRIDRYDTYYYARRGREMHLPAWRVVFADSSGAVVYLNAVTGAPVGFVDNSTRRWRWARDALHSFDFPALNRRPRIWSAIVLLLMLGGVALSGTGMWLVLRRLRRIARRDEPWRAIDAGSL